MELICCFLEEQVFTSRTQTRSAGLPAERTMIPTEAPR